MPTIEALAIDDADHGNKKTSTTTKVLVVVAVLMTIVVIVLAVLFGLSVNNQAAPTTTTGDTQSELCQSQACITAASRVLNAMNLHADPCEDFYEYACGTWDRDHLIPDDKPSVSPIDSLQDDVSKVLKRVLERDSTNDRESIKKAKNFYASCMDIDKIESLGVAPVNDLITEMGGWPVVSGSFTPSMTLEELLGTFLTKYGTDAIMSSSVIADPKNSTANIILIDQPSLGMPSRDYYVDEATRNTTEPQYRQFMTDFITVVAGDMANKTRIDSVVDQIIQLETDLAGSMAPDSERRNVLANYRKMTLKDLGNDIGEIDWIAYLNQALEISGDPLLQVDETEEVVIYAINYLNNVSAIIGNRMELIQNYLVWRVLKDRIGDMSSNVSSTILPYLEATIGTLSAPPRWQGCSDDTNSYFPMPTGALFVQEVFPEESKQATDQMVKNLRAAFKEMLLNSDWMDQETKNTAEDKANQINPIIAYPNYILNSNNPKMDDEYAQVKVNVSAYFASIQDLVQVNSKKNFEKLRKPVDFEEWLIGPAVVNAGYALLRNQIVFPAGILQPPFYDAGQPASMNYGAIGMVIGHEITHGFDDSGSQFDGQGNLNNWWSNSSRENFNRRSQCMIDQYSNISWDTAFGLNIDGEFTLGENIADNGGLREAFNAYQKWKNDNPGGDLKLPGLGNFTQDQLFFIGNAQIWCGKYTPLYAVLFLKTDPHSPSKFRVLVPNKNFPEFGRAYGCKQNEDPMFPPAEDTCRVW